jgi:H+/gluconate symporter-like permease
MIGIILGLVLLMFLAFKGYSIIWAAPVSALVVAITGGLDLLDMYKSTYMAGLAGFLQTWFPVFLLGAIFGHLMDHTGAAKAIARWLTKVLGAKRAILSVVVGCAVLTYGGISLFVVVFAMYPLALGLFREANITRKLIPGTIALGAFTFTMTAAPGTPQIQNLIPMKYFGTTATAGPVMGVVASLVLFFGGMFWLSYREKKFNAAGDRFIEPEKKGNVEQVDYSSLPNPFLSFLPLITVILTLNLFKWDIIIALLCGIILSMVLNLSKYKGFTKSLTGGASGSIVAIFNTAAAVGFGSVVKVVPGFQTLTNSLMNIPGSPLISEAVAVNLLAGATGSASGGMSIALEALGEKFMQVAAQSGIDPQAFHRIASLASGGLDTLPHNGAVLTLLTVTGLTHKDSYIDICVTSLVMPIIASIPAIILGSLGIY